MPDSDLAQALRALKPKTKAARMREVMPVIEERIAAGVPAKKIRVVFNKVDVDDAGDLPRLFSLVFGCHDAHKGFTLRPDAVLFSNEVFDRLRPLKMTVAEVIADENPTTGPSCARPRTKAARHTRSA